jgi:hypothetical protein
MAVVTPPARPSLGSLLAVASRVDTGPGEEVDHVEVIWVPVLVGSVGFQ